MTRTFRLAALSMLLLATATGCHTSLRKPAPLCQCLEDRCGDAVDGVGRSTSISNAPLNHCVTRTCRACPVTRKMGRCSKVGGPFWHD